MTASVTWSLLRICGANNRRILNFKPMSMTGDAHSNTVSRHLRGANGGVDEAGKFEAAVDCRNLEIEKQQ
jgi:hypothetical protein